MKSRRIADDAVKEKVIEDFGNSADTPVTNKKTAKRFRRYTFSLTEDVSSKIDELTLITARINRSDVIKAGVIALSNMSKEDIKLLFNQAKENY